MQKYFNGYSVFTGVVRYGDLSYLLATYDDDVKDEIPHTRIYTLDAGKWGGEDLDWSAISASVCYSPEERFITISPLGRVHILGGGENMEEPSIKDKNFTPKKRGPLREVRGIAAGRAYAVGTCRQAYRRDAPGKWVCIDQGAQASAKDNVETCFESIDGFSETDIYTVGWEGEIWHYDGKKWKEIDSPTNLTLFNVKCGTDGNIYACGQMGTLLRGRGEEWSSIEHDATEDNLRDLEWYDGSLYVSSMKNIFKLVDNQLHKVELGKDVPSTCHHLNARDGIMWSIGAKDVMSFDGKKWTRIV